MAQADPLQVNCSSNFEYAAGEEEEDVYQQDRWLRFRNARYRARLW